MLGWLVRGGELELISGVISVENSCSVGIDWLVISSVLNSIVIWLVII